MSSEEIKERPKTLNLKPPILELNDINGISKDDGQEYVQIKPMQKSFSENDMLSGEKDKLSVPSHSTGKRSFSSPYILEGSRKKSLYVDMLQKKEYYSLFILAPNNRIRRLAIAITEAKLFDYFILMTIIFTCIVMAMDAPLPNDDKSSMNKIAGNIEYFLLGIFGCEAILRIIAMGFVLHPHSYLRSIWNILDFIVVISGIFTLEVFIGSKPEYNLKSLRAIRVLRPLKLISGIPSLQVVMTSIVRAVVPLLQVLFLVVFVIVIYAIIGLEFCYNKFHYGCFDLKNQAFDGKPCDKNANSSIYFISGHQCGSGKECRPGWTGFNHGITTFDNVFLAMITVFQCVTMEGWTDIMYNTLYIMDTSGVLWGPYYVSLVVIGSFFMLNLVLGVLSGEFAKEREKVENRRAFLKLRQENLISNMCDAYLAWIEKGEDAKILDETDALTNENTPLEKTDLDNIVANPILVIQHEPDSPQMSATSHCREKFQRFEKFIRKSQVRVKRIVKHQYFFWLVICMVLINTIIMALTHYQQPQWLTDVQNLAEWFFISVFSLEILIKIFAHGFVGYCRSLFNIFDLVVVCLSLIEILLKKEVSPDFNCGFSVLRCLRLLRAFKVTKYWSSLRNLVTSLMNAMKSILSLLFLLFLFIVILALLGMQLFGGRFVKLKESPRTRFDSFGDSLLAVFQVITGEDWNAVMYNGMMVYGGTTPTGLVMALYFIFLVVFGNYTLLNVFLAIAVDNLTNAEILTHDEEAAEVKLLELNLRNALEADKELNENAISFVANLQAKALSMQEEENQRFGNVNTIDGTETQADGDLTETGNGIIIQNGGSEHSNGNLSNRHSTQSLVLQNGNSQLMLNNTKERKSISVFDKVLLDVPDRQKSSDIISYLSPKKTPESYMLNVQKKWRNIVDYSTDHPEIFPENNNTKRPNTSLSVPGNELDDIENIDDIVDDKDEKIDNDGEDEKVDEVDDDEDEEDVEKEIQQKGMLNVLKFNVTNRRRIARKKPMIQHNSLFCLTPTNRVRKICHTIVHFQYFDWFIMIVILMSSITLAFEDPVNDESARNKVLRKIDYFFAVVFGLEVILKVIDSGLILHKRAYLRSFWNFLDAFVFACNLTSIILTEFSDKSGSAIQIIMTLRVLRVLRPLKAIQRVKKLKAVFQCVVYSLKNVAFVLIITLLFLFIFACIGVQLFQGKFFYCTDPSKKTKEECKGYFYEFKSATSVVDKEPVVNERIWKQRKFHFDNVVDAMITLYTSATGEGWPSSMHYTIDATKPGEGPSRNNNQHMAIYYFVFVIIFTFMIINIYIALIILTFQRQGEKEIEGSLDRNQRDCLSFVLNSKPQQRYMPADKNSISYRIWLIVEAPPFDYFIMALIILNTIQLAMKHHNQSKHFEEVLTALNIGFTVLFCIEAFLKIIAYRINYFKDFWNLFDFMVVLGSLGDVIVSSSKNASEFIDPSMFRLFRTARLVKLLRKSENIQLMLWTFLQSFKALPYVTFLLTLLYYIYAIIGMQLFGKIKTGSLDSAIHEYNNFQSLLPALQVLFRSSTGESWNSIMYACYDHAECVDGSFNCGNKVLSVIYFLTFIFFCMFLLNYIGEKKAQQARIQDFFQLLNLFVAVIMDNFEYLTRDASILGPHHLDEFIRCWSEFDPQATGSIHHDLVYKLLCQLSPPVGFGKQCPKEIAYKRLIQMNMPVLKDGVSVSFHTTLLALIRTSLNIFTSGNVFDNEKELRRVMKTLWPKASQKRLHKLLPKAKGDRQLTVGKIYCVKLIIMKYRKARGKGLAEKKKESSPSVLKRLNSLIPSLRRKLSSRSSTNPDNPKEKDVQQHKEVRRLQTFGGRIRRSQNEHHTRDGQLRRRSSWSDIPGFFRFGSNKETSASTSNLPTNSKDVPTPKLEGTNSKMNHSGHSTLTANPSNNIKSGRLSPNYNSGGNNRSSKSNVTRTGSLRTNSNGNVITHQHHRKGSGSSVHSLQYDPLSNKESSIRYQQKSGKVYHQSHPNSAPSTPRGLSSRQNFDYRGNTTQNSPMSRRPTPAHQQLHGSHRRSHSNPGSNLLDKMMSKEQQQQHYNSYRNNNFNNDPRFDNSRNDVSKYVLQNSADNRRSLNTGETRSRNNNITVRKNISQENDLDNYNNYHSNVPHQQQQHYDMYNRDPGSSRSGKYLMESRSLPVQGHDLNPNYAQLNSSYDCRGSSSHDPRVGYQKTNDPSVFQSKDGAYGRDTSHLSTQQHHYNDIDYRNNPGDIRRNSQPLPGSPQKHSGNMYSNSNDYHTQGDMYNVQNKSNQLEPSKRDRGIVSPRQQQSQQQQQRQQPSGQYYPNTDNDLINGAPSQQYYDNMISQINDQIARASEGGAPTQPFNMRVQNTAPAVSDDDNEWC